MDLRGQSVSIGGRTVTNLRFADDIELQSGPKDVGLPLSF